MTGGLYKETEAPQGKDGSAMDVMAASKMQIVNEGYYMHHFKLMSRFIRVDLHRQLFRYGLKGMTPHHQPQRTLHAMRILAGIENHEMRVQLSKEFYKV